MSSEVSKAALVRRLEAESWNIVGSVDWPEAAGLLREAAAALALPSAAVDADDEIDAKLDALHKRMCEDNTHNGGMVGVAWNRAVYRAALYTAPPADPRAVDEAMVERAYEKLRGWLPNQTDTGRALSRQVIRDALTAAITGGRS